MPDDSDGSPFDYPRSPSLDHVDRGLLASASFADGGGYPPSYSRFVSRAGWARTAGLWLIYPPVLPGYADGVQGRGAVLTQQFRAVYRDNEEEGFDFTLEPDGRWDLIDRLEAFGFSENGDLLLWDVTERDERGEFPLWLSANLNALERIGDTLDEALLILNERGESPRPVTVEPLPPTRL
ncbi:hypothetical protein [uncultured Microbacterium sp.]|uniref:hypothetical protein n=1 Tax=uncultured Microbacterium sp. TaxID=191216 RepID=UPI0025F02FE6|nr:hypothetical protein [uncultured Microbacterium sp.]